MRLSLETDEVVIEISVPGPYSPDIADDIAKRAVEVYERTLAINDAHVRGSEEVHEVTDDE